MTSQMRPRGSLRAILAVVFAAGIAARIEAASVARGAPRFEAVHWPAGTVQAPFEDLDGVTLLQATATGSDGRDTSGAFVLDTGAGFIALDKPLAVKLGIATPRATDEIQFTSNPLPAFRLGDLDIQQVQAIIFDAEVIRDVVDRPVLGLLGQQPMRDRALCLDYQAKRIALVPAITSEAGADSALTASRALVSGMLSTMAIPLPFRIAAGGKVLVRVRVVPRQGTPSRWLTFVFDTGATKCALFPSSAMEERKAAGWGPAIHALETPTLLGRNTASLIRAARVEAQGTRDTAGLGTAAAPDVDVLLVDSPLGRELSQVTGETVSGLLGYSFLRRFRVVCDYPHRVLWLDPVVGFQDDRPYEHSHVGLQLERREGVVRVMSVARPSPAARAGIRPGDEVIAIDRVQVAGASLLELSHMLEGKAGTLVSFTLRRDGHETSYHLRRQRLL